MTEQNVKFIVIRSMSFEGDDVRYFANREELEKSIADLTNLQDIEIYEVARTIKLKWVIDDSVEAKKRLEEKK